MVFRSQVVVCGDTGCVSGKSPQIKDEFVRVLKEYNLENEVFVYMAGCFGFCEQGPLVIIHPDEVLYAKLKPEDVRKIVEEHLLKGKPVKRLQYKERDPETNKQVQKKVQEVSFYAGQKKFALRNVGIINPDDIDEYIGRDGYFALEKALNHMTPDQVIEEVLASGLRGRGGGGFPTGLKWKFTAQNKGGQSYVICNADEGDPGAFMDRAVLEGDPHSVIEAMTITGYAVGSNQGYIYVRAEYPSATARMQRAINKAYEYGLLGKNILNSGFDFDLEIRLGAGAFVCGEETALIRSIEGNRGMPTIKPPYPANEGLWDRPTVINNVETYANIPLILNKGAKWFSAIGTEKSKGTKVFALGGKINNTGLIEVPMGTTVRQIIYDIGGGIPNGKKFKAVQTGGPSGGCLTEKDLDTPIDYDNLIAKGSMMGSGGMIVMDEDNCMVDVAKFFMEFIVDESCGKCTPCREGTRRLYELVDDITKGKGTMATLDELRRLSQTIKDTSLCGLGQTAPNPVLSTLNNFYDEYVAHVVDKKCPAGVCTELTELMITDKCIGCGRCTDHCPVNAISGNLREKHVIDTELCIHCNLCITMCPVYAIKRV
ncbi:MAG: NADH-quinone oxidoreductase subunit NuoF [Acholeplasmataceae bacterium]|jgi:NADH:ubiquinone oxidoreductase subunit F (NADH-binding)/(2Fe-2S) ferredoxin/Pyruvate/2-oxoacid:ferredoxin oxidoreductase delta subunit